MQDQRVRRRTARRAVVAAVLASLAACSHAVYHRVRPGENLYRISKAYGVSVQRLAAVNHLADPSRIAVGQRLRIPGARRELPVDVITPRAAAPAGAQPDGPPPGAPRFIWPVRGGSVISGFGRRGQSVHDGIDIRVPAGAPVRAAADGEVIYSDALRGYGNVIIVRHRGGYATVYAHNRENQVREGERVRRGEVIATVGDSGRTLGANLHFEIRYDNVARDPLPFLPPLERVAVPRAPAPGG
jgi:lipoprotein NlpD